MDFSRLLRVFVVGVGEGKEINRPPWGQKSWPCFWRLIHSRNHVQKSWMHWQESQIYIFRENKLSYKPVVWWLDMHVFTLFYFISLKRLYWSIIHVFTLMWSFKRPGNYKNFVNLPIPSQTTHFLFLYLLCSNWEVAWGSAGSLARQEVENVGMGTPVLEAGVLEWSSPSTEQLGSNELSPILHQETRQ